MKPEISDMVIFVYPIRLGGKLMCPAVVMAVRDMKCDLFVMSAFGSVVELDVLYDEGENQKTWHWPSRTTILNEDVVETEGESN
jgi:hypothetical protein